VEDDQPPALGAVIEQGRGSLPFALIHGEALVACAAWGLGESGVTPVDLGTEWAGLVDGGEPFVLHDSLCPMTPGSFIAECLVRAVETDTVVVGVRPVTDTVKVVRHGVIGETVDRDTLRTVASPVVLPARVVAELDALPALDFVELVGLLEARFGVEYVEAPSSARRVTSPGDVALLEALTQPLR
jgi:2-C-methyl-D-erythritol 4-phosphate cytidylyltransferase